MGGIQIELTSYLHSETSSYIVDSINALPSAYMIQWK